jgi:hypothetical protein
MRGDGEDVLATFIIVGTYADNGSCEFTKRYDCGREVVYRGQYVVDGDRAGVVGRWSIGELLGLFWIEPRRRSH